jgi:uncharacterized radical SAM superfamily Fe-S cluster-containing enzyme
MENLFVLVKGKKMENQIQIICPHCKRTQPDSPVIDSAVRGEFHGSTFITCECGETITFWAITAQLRKQNTLGKRIKKWFHNFSNRPA